MNLLINLLHKLWKNLNGLPFNHHNRFGYALQKIVDFWGLAHEIALNLVNNCILTEIWSKREWLLERNFFPVK